MATGDIFIKIGASSRTRWARRTRALSEGDNLQERNENPRVVMAAGCPPRVQAAQRSVKF
jgi:hypothetical protein